MIWWWQRWYESTFIKIYHINHLDYLRALKPYDPQGEFSQSKILTIGYGHKILQIGLFSHPKIQNPTRMF